VAIDLDRLAKIWKLTTSPNPGEAASARNRAQATVEREGKTLADIPGLLSAIHAAKPTAAPQPNAFNPFAGFDDYMEEKEPGYKAQRARRAAEQQQQEKDELAGLVAKYGSEDAIIQLSPLEAKLRAAVLKWCVFQKPPYDTRWIDSIDGHSESYRHDKITSRVKNALSKAIPLPLTVTDAFNEYTMWNKRDRERQLVFENLGDTQLDLPSAFRQEIVRRLFEVELRARNIAEVLIRQRHLVDGQISNPEIEQAVLLDLEGLLTQQENAQIVTPQRTAAEPRSRPCEINQPDMFA
jgi:hypothetical protein